MPHFIAPQVSELEHQRDITRSLYIRLNGAYEHAANTQRKLDAAYDTIRKLAKRISDDYAQTHPGDVMSAQDFDKLLHIGHTGNSHHE